MTQSELKELTNLGAELGAAKAENEAMRAALEEVLAAAEGRHLRPWLAIEAARAALSQQAEPTDTYTAVDMATAAAQGFRDGQAATVKDCLTVQPMAYAVFADNGNVACFSTQREHPSLVAFEADGHSVVSLAPIAQTALQGTTSDKYRAELYDEVWEKARSMGYSNVTDALIKLERMKAAPQPEQSRWISVEDRLPPVRQILSDSCVLEGKEIPTLYRSTDVICWDGKRVGCQIVEWFHAKMPIGGVTHWMPLPAAPAQGGQ